MSRKLVALVPLMALQACQGPPGAAVASLYEVEPEQCPGIRDDYMATLMDPGHDPHRLEYLTCRVNKCAAMEKILEDGIGGRRQHQPDPATRSIYAPEALGGHDCDALLEP